MAKSNIELEQAFYVDGIKYICVGHDNDLIWGVTHVNVIEEAQGFDFYKCTVKSEFTLST